MNLNVKPYYGKLTILISLYILKVSRDQSFTATKSKETRKKILAQENTKDSDIG